MHTASGDVRGRLYDGCRVWRGVPFGAPPTGELRWRTPQPHEAWSGVRAATEPAPQCPQLDLVRGVHFGQEDCLYLSVYAPPQCTPTKPCPTLFWIYGGAWTLGGNGEFGLYTGEHLAMRLARGGTRIAHSRARAQRASGAIPRTSVRSAIHARARYTVSIALLDIVFEYVL